MAGFRNVAAWAQCFDAGRFHMTAFRKAVASAATVANDFVDYTYFAGNPVANFYASAPLEAAHIEANNSDTTYHTHCQWCGDPSDDGRKYCSYGMESCATDANRRDELLKRQGL